MKLQLLYSSGCPNVDAARENVRLAVAGCRSKVRVEEIEATLILAYVL